MLVSFHWVLYPPPVGELGNLRVFPLTSEETIFPAVIFPLPTERPVQIEISQAIRDNGSANGVSELKGIVSVGISIEDPK